MGLQHRFRACVRMETLEGFLTDGECVPNFVSLFLHSQCKPKKKREIYLLPPPPPFFPCYSLERLTASERPSKEDKEEVHI